MKPISLAEFAAGADDYDRCVAGSSHLDGFCSSADWILPAASALMPRRRPWVFRDGRGFVALMLARHPHGFRVAEPLEAAWGLACPLVGRDPAALADSLLEVCSTHSRQWDLLAVTGVLDGTELASAIEERLRPGFPWRPGRSTDRYVASLEGGIDGFLARRSRNLRRSLRRASTVAVQAGVSFEVPDDGETPEQLYRRILDVEARSWKGIERVGITHGPMREFYWSMLRRLVRRRRLRLLFARYRDGDIGYILGGVHAGCYRGLQFSYDKAFRELSIGNLLQLNQVQALCAEADITRYDLGTTSADYKLRWADEVVTSTLRLVINPQTVAFA